MLIFCQNIAGAMRSSIKHAPTLFPSKIEECRLSLKQILNEKRRVSICVKNVNCVVEKESSRFGALKHGEWWIGHGGFPRCMISSIRGFKFLFYGNM